MYVLDTDHASFLQRPLSSEGQRLRFRLSKIETHKRVITIITFEEQMRGWMATIAKANSLSLQIEAYRWLDHALDFYSKNTLISFNERAAEKFKQLKGARIRIGTMDLKIAAIALTNNATLLTRNLVDFRKVPDLRVEDWSI
jgi:tRNA(fMet)-specific endonuclease VapC